MKDHVGKGSKKRLINRLDSMKLKLKQAVDEGNLSLAIIIIEEYEKAGLPRDQDFYAIQGLVFILLGDLDSAKLVLETAANQGYKSFDISFNLGYIHEKKGEYFHAFISYRNAEYFIQEAAERRDLEIALARIKEHFKMKIHYSKEDGYQVVLTEGSKMTVLNYSQKKLQQRKELLDLIVANLHPKSRHVLEIECAEGIVTRNLSYCGVHAVGLDSNNENIYRALILEYQTRLRSITQQDQIKYYHNTAGEDNVANFSDIYDAILLVPDSYEWYMKNSLEVTAKIIQTLIEKANRQFILKLPCPETQEEMAYADSLEQKLHQLDSTKAVTRVDRNVEASYPRVFLVEPSGVSYAKHNFIPKGLEIVNSKSRIVEVELEKCRDLQGFSYGEEGWHHFVATLDQYVKNPEIEYKDSVLKEFYDKFQPKNRQEQLFEDVSEPLAPLSQGWTVLPWIKNQPGLVFSPKESVETRPGGSHHYGPNTEEFGKEELYRIITPYKAMKDVGYQPEIYMDGFISGIILRNRDDYRFVVTEGQHRMAAIAVMGYKTLRCMIDPDAQWDGINDISKVKKWDQVKNGLYSKELAEKVFFRFFESGREKARNIGMIR